MSATTEKVTPTSINLHQKSRLLEIGFSDGKTFSLPCEYLRVFSPAAEVKIATTPVHGKAEVNISRIEQKGNYALQLFFDDGHETGIYSWDTLYQLGADYDQNWAAYLLKLKEFNLDRSESGSDSDTGETSINILYFMHLATIAGKDAETIVIPDSVNTVTALLSWLRARGEPWKQEFDEERVQVTVNKNFAEPATPIEQGDEVAIVPRGLQRQ
jgi:DUF971 family protein/molybdopterin converting factor small subunit